MNMEKLSNDKSQGEKPKFSDKNLSHCHSVHQKLYIDYFRIKQAFCGQNITTNHHSYGKAYTMGNLGVQEWIYFNDLSQ